MCPFDSHKFSFHVAVCFSFFKNHIEFQFFTWLNFSLEKHSILFFLGNTFLLENYMYIQD
jgi:hypothetical protein